MGRGNSCVFGNYEGLYYVNWNNFSNEYEDEEGNIIVDEDMRVEEWEEALSQFIFDLTKKYPSFSICEEWISNTEKAVLENSLFYIAVEDNEWSMAVKLIQKEQSYYSRGNIVNLQAGLFMKYLNGIRDCLFNQFDVLGTYEGAWTNGCIKKTV